MKWKHEKSPATSWSSSSEEVWKFALGPFGVELLRQGYEYPLGVETSVDWNISAGISTNRGRGFTVFFSAGTGHYDEEPWSDGDSE